MPITYKIIQHGIGHRYTRGEVELLQEIAVGNFLEALMAAIDRDNNKRKNKDNMSKKSFKRVPFKYDTAQAIIQGKAEGRIVTFDGKPVTIIGETKDERIIVTVEGRNYATMHDRQGANTDAPNDNTQAIYLDIPIAKPAYEFKPYDKVLVRNCEAAVWDITFFSHYDYEHNRYITMGRRITEFCIPYEGNENLVGTTNDPKEDL